MYIRQFHNSFVVNYNCIIIVTYTMRCNLYYRLYSLILCTLRKHTFIKYFIIEK